MLFFYFFLGFLEINLSFRRFLFPEQLCNHIVYLVETFALIDLLLNVLQLGNCKLTKLWIINHDCLEKAGLDKTLSTLDLILLRLIMFWNSSDIDRFRS